MCKIQSCIAKTAILFSYIKGIIWGTPRNFSFLIFANLSLLPCHINFLPLQSMLLTLRIYLLKKYHVFLFFFISKLKKTTTLLYRYYTWLFAINILGPSPFIILVPFFSFLFFLHSLYRCFFFFWKGSIFHSISSILISYVFLKSDSTTQYFNK